MGVISPSLKTGSNLYLGLAGKVKPLESHSASRTEYVEGGRISGDAFPLWPEWPAIPDKGLSKQKTLSKDTGGFLLSIYMDSFFHEFLQKQPFLIR